MPDPDRSVLHTVEVILALAVLLVITVMTTNFPVDYPTDPALGGVLLNPELVVPAVFGVVVLVNTVTEGFGVWSVVAGLLGIVAVLLAILSIYTLYTTDPGMFAGGLFTLAAGTLLALLVLGRQVVDTVSNRWHADTVSST